jgi:hypothetical protein
LERLVWISSRKESPVTGPNRQSAIREEMERAEVALSASTHLATGGVFADAVSRLFARLMKYREEADYNASYLFSSEDNRTLKVEVEVAAGRLGEVTRAAGEGPADPPT